MSCEPKNIQDFVDIAQHLAKQAIFAGVEQGTVQAFADAARLRSEPKGKVLFIQEDEAEWFYVVLSGWVKLFRETIDGTEAVVDVLPAGHMFGETSVFENDCYNYSAELVEPTQYLMLPTSMLKTAIAENSQIALNMLNSLSHHRQQQSREIEHLNLQNAPQRIGCFLLRLCPVDVADNITIHLPYDKTLIAARLGMKPETFSRALAKLKAETNIVIKGSMVTIPVLSTLVEYTCNHCSSSFPCEDMKG